MRFVLDYRHLALFLGLLCTVELRFIYCHAFKRPFEHDLRFAVRSFICPVALNDTTQQHKRRTLPILLDHNSHSIPLPVWGRARPHLEIHSCCQRTASLVALSRPRSVCYPLSMVTAPCTHPPSDFCLKNDIFFYSFRLTFLLETNTHDSRPREPRPGSPTFFLFLFLLRFDFTSQVKKHFHLGLNVLPCAAPAWISPSSPSAAPFDFLLCLSRSVQESSHGHRRRGRRANGTSEKH